MAKSDKLPAFQFYPGDWHKDPGVQALEYFDRGVWLEILLLMHESEERGALMLNGAPMPDSVLARVLGLDNQIISKTISTLLTYGVASRREDGALINRRMIRDEEIRQKRIKAGSMGGNPNFEPGKANPYYQKDNQNDKQKITPSSSSSSSSSEVIGGTPKGAHQKKDSHRKKLRESREEVLSKISDGELQRALRGWCDWRENEHPKRKPVTPMALKQTLKKYEKRGAQLLADIRWSVSQDWEGIFPEKKFEQRSSFEAKKPEPSMSKRGLDFVKMAMPKINMGK